MSGIGPRYSNVPLSPRQTCTYCLWHRPCLLASLESGRPQKAARAISQAACTLRAVSCGTCAGALQRQCAATAPLLCMGRLSPEAIANSQHCASGLCAALPMTTAEWGRERAERHGTRRHVPAPPVTMLEPCLQRPAHDPVGLALVHVLDHVPDYIKPWFSLLGTKERKKSGN